MQKSLRTAPGRKPTDKSLSPIIHGKKRMRSKWIPLSLLLALFLAQPNVADGHFFFLYRHLTPTGTWQLHAVFGEGAEPGEPELFKNLGPIQIWQLTPDAKPQKLAATRAAASAWVALNSQQRSAIQLLNYEYGVIERGGEPFLLKYSAKSGPEPTHPNWSKVDSRQQLSLDVLPQVAKEQLQLLVLWQGKPIAGAEATIVTPDGEVVERASSSKGLIPVGPNHPGLHVVRVRFVEERAGEHQGKTFESVRHYTTVTLGTPVTTPEKSSQTGRRLPDLVEPVTSFGAAVLGSRVFVYGGHLGDAHDYWDGSQSDKLWMLDANDPHRWSVLSKGPALQGLALVSDGDKLYRIGGFEARNTQGEDHDLWSQAAVDSFDPRTGKWTSLPGLPEPRSSLDAAVLNHTLYVVGGWQLAGKAEPKWHPSAYALNLREPKSRWTELPKPPFVRRALAVAAFADRLYAVGGMEEGRGPSTKVDIYDPTARSWSRGPELPRSGMNGFGASAFAAGESLYVSISSGQLLRLSDDGKSWENVQQLERARFFHRMLPLSRSELLFLGGVNMESGKFPELDVVKLK